MRLNADVVYRDIDSSPALTDTIHKKIAKLHRFSDLIQNSRVTLNSPNKSKANNKATIFRARIELDVNGTPILATQDNPSAHIAIRDAFNTVERKIKESRPKHRDIKH